MYSLLVDCCDCCKINSLKGDLILENIIASAGIVCLFSILLYIFLLIGTFC